MDSLTLKVFTLSSDRTNYRILKLLPADTAAIIKEIKITKGNINRRINELNKFGLVTRNRGAGRVYLTDLGKSMLLMFDKIKEDVAKSAGKMLEGGVEIMKTVTLKNGSEEAEILVITTMTSLEELVKTNPIAAFELVEVCKNSEHKPFGNTGKIIESLGLMKNGCVHDSIKNIVLSAFEGENFDLCLVNPIKK